MSYHPYYLSYYNPLAGSSQTAVRVLPVGWGEGMEQAARSLSQKPNAQDLRVAAWGMVGLAPFFPGKLGPLTPLGMLAADYVVVYSDDLQTNFPLSRLYHNQVTPETVIRAHGIDYAWIYPNTRFRAPMAAIESRAQPGDAILVNVPLPGAERYAGTVPLFTLDVEGGESAVIARLNQIATERRRLWLLEFTDPKLAADRQGWARYQLDTHAYLLEDFTEGNVRITAYRLPESPGFRAATPGPLAVDFGGQLRLAGADLGTAVAEWGRSLGVVLAWESIANTTADLNAFLHLEDTQGNRWGQGDAPIEDDEGRRTAHWPVGTHGQSRHRLQLLAGTPPGHYRLKAGVYVASTGARVSPSVPAPGSPLTGVILGEVEVVRSPVAVTVKDLGITHPLNNQPAAEVELLGFDLRQTTIGPGRTLPLDLFWRAPAEVRQDYRLRLELYGPDGTVQAAEEYPLVSPDYPTTHWQAGEALRGQYHLRVDRMVPGGPTNLVASLLAPTGVAATWLLTEVTVQTVQRRFEVPEIRFPYRARLGEGVTFLGYDMLACREARELESKGERETLSAPLNAQSCGPSSGLETESLPHDCALLLLCPPAPLLLTLYWQARSPMNDSFHVFVHLLDDQGQIRGQRDQVPAAEGRPTTSWVASEIITDTYQVPLAEGAPPGEYRIAIGMYNPTTGEHLPLRDTVPVTNQDQIVLPIKVQFR